jgi:hypothetical protein
MSRPLKVGAEKIRAAVGLEMDGLQLLRFLAEPFFGVQF